ncbi:hypothetical protein SHIRM173S_07204 [Streptomyces hirsutus]
MADAVKQFFTERRRLSPADGKRRDTRLRRRTSPGTPSRGTVRESPRPTPPSSGGAARDEPWPAASVMSPWIARVPAADGGPDGRVALLRGVHRLQPVGAPRWIGLDNFSESRPALAAGLGLDVRAYGPDCRAASSWVPSARSPRSRRSSPGCARRPPGRPGPSGGRSARRLPAAPARSRRVLPDRRRAGRGGLLRLVQRAARSARPGRGRGGGRRRGGAPPAPLTGGAFRTRDGAPAPHPCLSCP